MTRLEPIFARSLSLLQTQQSKQEAASLSDKTQVEMLNLAQLVLSAVAHGAGIEVRIIQGVGFKLISESAHEEKLAEVAKVLSLVGSCTVFYSSSDGTTMQQCDPLGVPVYVAHVPAYVGVRRAIAHELFKILAQPVDRGLEAGASFNLSGSLKEQLSRLCSWELATRESGLPELVIKRDFSLLANDEFLGIIKELHGAGAAFLLRFDPGFEALCLATHEVIGAKAAWKLERKDKVFLLTVYRTPDLDERYIAAAVECLVARVGANIAVQYAIPDGLTCIAPTATETGTPPKCTPTTYLKCSMSAAVPNSNIVTCTIPFETRDSESLKFISDHIAPGSAFVKIVPQRPPGLMSHSQYCEALEHLAARLGIPRLRHRVNQAGKNLVSVAPLATIPDLGSLVTCMAYGKTLASVSASKSEISHPMTRAEMFTFFARTVGHECEWDVKVHADSVAVHTTRPELFSKSIKRMFGVIFGRPLTVVREPEEIQGEYLLSPAQARARTAANQFFPAEFDRILPRGFGEAPIVRQHGNRIIVYSTTENLPRAYIDSVVPDLYGISTPVIIRRDMLASRVKDAATLSDIVVRSLPVGTYLRKIVETEDTFVLELSNVGGARVLDEEVLQAIAACSSKKIAQVSVSPTEEFREVMSCLSTEIDKRFYALAINADNVVANEEKLKRLFLWLYDYKSELPRDVKRRESGYLGDVLDLTSLNCFSIDKLDTRIREDAFSVKELPAGGFQFGVHVSAGARQIIPGSPAEILARRRGSSSIPTFGDKEYPFRCFAEPFRKLFDLNPKRNSVTFSLMFETDASYNIKPDTYELRLAEIQNARALSFEQAANLLNGAGVRAHESALVQHLQHARALVHAQNSRGSSFADSSALIKPVDIAYGLLSIFNSYAHKLLEEQEIELPPPLQSGLGAGRVKFNAPVRDYKVLLAQRQLDRFLEGREPLSSSEMQQQLDSTGVSAIRSSAFRLIAVTEELRMRAPSATVVLQSGGQLSVLGRPDSLTSPFARADEPEDESEGE